MDVPGRSPSLSGPPPAGSAPWVAVGVNERVASGTLYNSLLYLDPQGEVAGAHRKLMPTGGERTVWGYGDPGPGGGAGQRSVDQGDLAPRRGRRAPLGEALLPRSRPSCPRDLASTRSRSSRSRSPDWRRPARRR